MTTYQFIIATLTGLTGLVGAIAALIHSNQTRNMLHRLNLRRDDEPYGGRY